MVTIDSTFLVNIIELKNKTKEHEKKQQKNKQTKYNSRHV
jgi:hypothetical protein